VTGGGIQAAKNLFVPIGVSISDVVNHCGGLTPDARRVIAGGPMMGFTVTDLTVPITKATSGITVLTACELDDCAETTCIRCGRCVDVCPLGLVPTKIAHAAKFANRQQAETYDISACCECGCCAYVCPSRIPLVQYIRVGKGQWPR
jgi:electron transport complex protein RnfC